jgi:hypothetical protein
VVNRAHAINTGVATIEIPKSDFLCIGDLLQVEQTVLPRIRRLEWRSHALFVACFFPDKHFEMMVLVTSERFMTIK